MPSSKATSTDSYSTSCSTTGLGTTILASYDAPGVGAVDVEVRSTEVQLDHSEIASARLSTVATTQGVPLRSPRWHRIGAARGLPPARVCRTAVWPLRSRLLDPQVIGQVRDRDTASHREGVDHPVELRLPPAGWMHDLARTRRWYVWGCGISDGAAHQLWQLAVLPHRAGHPATRRGCRRWWR